MVFFASKLRRKDFTAPVRDAIPLSGGPKSERSSERTIAGFQEVSSKAGFCQSPLAFKAALHPGCPLLMISSDPSAFVITSTRLIGDWPWFGVCPWFLVR